MRELDAGSVDAIVTDPPYGLGFMGREWDSLPPGLPWARECLRVLKPGGHLLAFGGTRTYHRLACAVEDAGFEIRDCIAWLYGSGFPKSLDVSKAIDAQAGAVREVIGEKVSPDGVPYSALHGERSGRTGGGIMGEACAVPRSSELLTAPATPDAERWQGWGTALKPAHEPVVVARKPLAGTVAATVLAHGTGALNVDGCRVEGAKGTGQWGSDQSGAKSGIRADGASLYGQVTGEGRTERHEAGRWPANVVLDPEAAAMLDEQTGELHSQDPRTRMRGQKSPVVGVTPFDTHNGEPIAYGDSGGASRFFYVPKASSAERNAGLDGFPNGDKRGQSAWGRTCNVCGCSFVDPTTGKPKCAHDDFAWTQTGSAKNVHPTVKPIDLMRWLVRLVTPPDGLVLDPFTGSGTTGCAAVLEGFRFLGIEREDEYAAIAEARIKWWAAQPPGVDVDAALEANAKRGKVEATGQMTIV